tara:strand:+ start:2176 stop:3141 length:966 start_codon:yes stop_codon:yes gene_type:complete
MIKNLPSLKLNKKPNGIYRFGFNLWLEKNIGLSKFHYIRCNWEHGWQDDEFICKNITLYKSWLNRKISQVVTTLKKKEFLENNNFSNIFIAPLPYYFIWRDLKYKEINNNNNNLLVLPNKLQHGVSDQEEEKRLNLYFDFIMNFKKNYENIYVSVPPDEKIRECYKNIFKKFDFVYIDGVSAYDVNGYNRVFELFNNFENITCQGMGSHIIYAQLMGKKISMCGPIYSTKRNISEFDINEDCPISKNKLREEFEYKASENYIKDNYSFLQKLSPLEGSCNHNWALRQIGDNKDISLIDIKKILNLSFTGQIKNAFAYIKNI